MMENTSGTKSSLILRRVLTTAAVLLLFALVFVAPAAAAGEVAQIGDTTYGSLQAAIDAASSGAEITLLSNIAETDITVATADNVIIDLKGYTVTGNFLVYGMATIKNGIIDSTVCGKSGIETNNEADRTLNPTLIVSDLTINSGRHAIRVDGGTVTINSGKYTAADAASNHAVNISGGGSVTINGGEFIGNTQNGSACIAIRNAGGTSQITINDGIFKGGASDLGSLTVWAGSAIVNGGTYETVYADSAVTITGGTFETIKKLVDGTIISGGTFDTPLDSTYDKYRAVASIEKDGVTNYYTTLADAINAVNANEPTTIKILVDNTYTMPSPLAGKDITFKGGKNVVIEMLTAINASGSIVTFDGVTVKFDNDKYEGLQHSTKVVYKNCDHIGTQFLYAPVVEFSGCTFEMFDASTEYSVWTYGSADVTFTHCQFNTNGKAILVYTEGAFTAAITLKDCTFNSNGTYDDKAAVEVGESANGARSTYTIAFENCEATGFVTNHSGSPLWGNKNDMDEDHLTVVEVNTDAVSNSLTYGQPLADIGSEAKFTTLYGNAVFTPTTYELYEKDTDTLVNPQNVGEYRLKISADAVNGYAPFAVKDVTIKKATLTVIPNALTKEFGETDPELTYTYSGNVTGEIPAFNGKLSRAEGEAEGTYLILQNTLVHIDNSTGNFIAANYDLEVRDVYFTITPKTEKPIHYPEIEAEPVEASKVTDQITVQTTIHVKTAVADSDKPEITANVNDIAVQALETQYPHLKPVAMITATNVDTINRVLTADNGKIVNVFTVPTSWVDSMEKLWSFHVDKDGNVHVAEILSNDIGAPQNGYSEVTTYGTSFSTHGLAGEEKQTPPPPTGDSSTPKGSSVWLTETQTPTPEQPTDTVPTEVPTTQPTPTETETPGFGVLAVLAGLGAVAVLRRK